MEDVFKDAVELRQEEGVLRLYFNGKRIPYIIDISVYQDVDEAAARIATVSIDLRVNTCKPKEV